MSTFNGIGTKFYGKRDVEEDGSYIATKWFTIVYLPIYPIGSFRMWDVKSTNVIIYRSKQFRYREEPLHKKQVLNTYLLVYIPILLVLIYQAIK